MKQVTLGRTGIKTNKNGFGVLPIQRVSDEYAIMLLKKAYDAGITFFDTARAYSDSEKKIGMALADVRKDIFIASKTMSRTVEGFWKDLETSLEYLKTDYLDLYQLHTPDFCPTPGDESGLYDALLKAKQQGKIRFIGMTNHKISVAVQAVQSGLYDTLQYQFNYLASQKDIDVVNMCKENNIGFIAMKGLSGGLLSHSDASYAWMDQFDNVLPIWGIQKESELDEFITYINTPPVLDDRIHAIIEKDRKELAEDFCRGCGYCMPCPVDIQINFCSRMSQFLRRSPSANWLTEDWQAKMKKIENCIDCGKCASKCPYNLDPPKLLRQHLADYKNVLEGKIHV